MNRQSNRKPARPDPDLVLKRMDEADEILSRTHPELRAPLRRFRILMRFHVFLKINARHGATEAELANALGIPEGTIARHLTVTPENPMYKVLSDEEKRWLHTYYFFGRKLQAR